MPETALEAAPWLFLMFAVIIYIPWVTAVVNHILSSALVNLSVSVDPCSSLT